jgi:hypothetical protein
MATQYSVSTGTVGLVAATPKTCIELPTSATAALTVIGVEYSFDATPPGSVVAEWMTFVTTGTGTTVTPLKCGTGQGAAANVGTVKINDSAEPGTLAAGTLPSWVIPVPGMYSILFPTGREFFQPDTVNRCLRLTSTVTGTIQVRIDLFFEQ